MRVAANQAADEQDTTAHEQVEQALVERAQQGDTEAFGELIERHRHKARGWAERMTGDPHMADDVVQDALIRAFLHLGSLADTSRFLPWLHRIVRNQANMRLRRGGPHHKERPFTSMGKKSSNSSQVDWEDLDSILYHLAGSAADAAVREQDPAESLLRKEMYETIHALLHCLSVKERGIFKAYFFRQLSPEEIAAMYRMTTGSIYTYIHRSRLKLRKEHIRVALGLIPEKKGGSGMARSRLLPLPAWPAHASVRTTLVDSIGRMLAVLGDRREISQLMGISTMAFRMKISNKTTFADGIYMYDWKRTVTMFMEELGYEVTMLTGQLSDTPVPLLGAVERFPVVLRIEEAVLPFIRKYLDMGKPVLYFDTMVSRPHIHDWSMIYGYDDAERLIYLTDPMRPEGKAIRYEDVTDNPVRFLTGIDGSMKKSTEVQPSREWVLQQQAVRNIRFAVEYARKGCSYQPMTSYLTYTSGLSAYDRWIGHLRHESIAPNRYGHGQLAAVYAETKRCAALYLRSVPLDGEAMRLTLLASEAFEQAADTMQDLSEYVPFIRTSEVLAPEMRERSAAYLEQAKEFEAAAIGYLERAISTMEMEK